MPKLNRAHAILLVVLIGLAAGLATAYLWPKAKPVPTPDGKPVSLTAQSFDPAIASGVHLVDFWADWCGPCHIQAPIIDEIAKRYAGVAGVGKLDIDSHEELAGRFSIASIPTLILFKDGQEARRFVGVQPEDVLAAAIDQALR